MKARACQDRMPAPGRKPLELRNTCIEKRQCQGCPVTLWNDRYAGNNFFFAGDHDAVGMEVVAGIGVKMTLSTRNACDVAVGPSLNKWKSEGICCVCM